MGENSRVSVQKLDDISPRRVQTMSKVKAGMYKWYNGNTVVQADIEEFMKCI